MVAETASFGQRTWSGCSESTRTPMLIIQPHLRLFSLQRRGEGNRPSVESRFFIGGVRANPWALEGGVQSLQWLASENLADRRQSPGRSKPVHGAVRAQPGREISVHERVDDHTLADEFASRYGQCPTHIKRGDRHEPTCCGKGSRMHPQHAFDYEGAHSDPVGVRAIGPVPGDDIPETVGNFRVEGA